MLPVAQLRADREVDWHSSSVLSWEPCGWAWGAGGPASGQPQSGNEGRVNLRRFGFWQTIVGIAILIIGLVGLLNNLGLVAITAGQVVGILFTLGLIALGVWLIWNAQRSRRVPRSINVILGDTNIGRQAWELRELVVRSGVGDVTVDLTRAAIPDREGRIDISGWVGDVEVLVPPGLGVRARGTVWVGGVRLLGRRAEGFFRDLEYTSSDFDTAEKRVVVDVNVGAGEVTVSRVE